MDIKPLVKLVLGNLLGDMSCFTDLLVANIAHSRSTTQMKVQRLYQNTSGNTDLQKQLESCDPKGPLCINIVKLFNNEMDDCFYAYGRVISGTLTAGQDVKVMGENFSLEEEEDVVVATASKLWILQAGGRFKIQIDKASAGTWVAIEGIDMSITKTATLTTVDQDEMETFRKLEFHSESAI